MRAVDSETMQRLDRRARELFAIPDLILMENAGLRASDAILEEFGSLRGKIGLFCGKGKNGGDGFVAARHLFLSGKAVSVFLIGQDLPSDPSSKTNLAILQKIGCPFLHLSSLAAFDEALKQERPFGLVVDALLGIGLKGEVREPIRSVIERLNRLDVPIVSLDIPSGLCATTGRVLGVCIQATVTITFGLPKKGLLQGEGPKRAGRVIVKPISLPLQPLPS